MSEVPNTTGRPSVSLSGMREAPGQLDQWSLMAIGLAGLCCCTAIAVVYTKHLSRAAWADISVSRSSIDDLTVEWSRLQIEESTFSDHGRVERAATERLGMDHPALDDTRFIVSGEVRL